MENVTRKLPVQIAFLNKQNVIFYSFTKLETRKAEQVLPGTGWY
jgi:hypothetical protein